MNPVVVACCLCLHQLLRFTCYTTTIYTVKFHEPCGCGRLPSVPVKVHLLQHQTRELISAWNTEHYNFMMAVACRLCLYQLLWFTCITTLQSTQHNSHFYRSKKFQCSFRPYCKGSALYQGNTRNQMTVNMDGFIYTSVHASETTSWLVDPCS